MATTQESIGDGVRWVLKLLRIGVWRALILGVFVAAFAAAVVLTSRDTVSDCGDVTDEQRELLAALAEPEPGRTFVATGRPRCVDGEFSAPLTGLPADMEEATRRLEGEGWILETTYIGYFRQQWRHCFQRDLAGWEAVQVTVDASRGGAVHTTVATAPENARACELERRDASRIYPPSDG